MPERAVSAKKRAKAAKPRRGKSGGKSGAPPLAPDGTAMVLQPHGGAIKQGGDHPRPGRPRNATRAFAEQLLKDKLLPRAVEVIGESKDGDLHLRAIEKVAEFAYNEKLRMAKLAAGGVVAGKPGAVAAVQVHVNGPPTGVERQD